MVLITQPSGTGGELKPSLRGRVDIAKYATGFMTLLNYTIQVAGGISKRSGQRYIVKAKYDDKDAVLIPFQQAQIQTYMLEFGDEYMRVYKDGGLVLNPDKVLLGVTKADPAVFECTAHGYPVGTWVFIGSVGGMRQVNQRFYIIDTVPDADHFTVTDLFGNVLNTTDFDAYTSGGTVASVYEIATPYDHADVASAYAVPGVSQEKIGLVYTQSANVMTITHEKYQQAELSSLDHDDWTLTPLSFAPNIAAPTGAGMSGPAATGGTSTIRYVITAVDAETGEESVASAPATSAVAKNPNSWVAADYIDLTWTAVSGISKYNVYKDKNGFYGFIGPAVSNSFRDDNIEPIANDSPPQAKNPFTGADNYPGAVTLHDQRRMFARTTLKPDTVFGTQTANYNNMNVSVPAKDSDALEFTIASEQVNAIKYLLSMDDLIAFTGNAEWKLAGSGDTQLSPSTVSARKQSARGIAPVRPLLVGNTALIAQARGKKVRDFRYTIEADGYDGNDISILSSHLFRKTRNVDKRIKNWAYQQEPDSLVWVVHNDGSLTTLTYQREHEVWGWSRHETDGKYLDVCCIPEGDVDAVYLLVERMVDGTLRRMVERIESRDIDEDDLDFSFFVDSGIQYTDNGYYDFYGLEHLEGKTVSILADGNTLPPQIVTGGKIVLDDVYLTLSVGLKIVSDVQPMDIQTTLKDGSTTKGKKIRVPKVWVEVYNSRGLSVGPSVDKLTPIKDERTNELMGEATRLQSRLVPITIQSTWRNRASIYLRHDDPTPCNILTITPDVEFTS